MKKIITLALIVVLCFVCVPAFAACEPIEMNEDLCNATEVRFVRQVFDDRSSLPITDKTTVGKLAKTFCSLGEKTETSKPFDYDDESPLWMGNYAYVQFNTKRNEYKFFIDSNARVFLKLQDKYYVYEQTINLPQMMLILLSDADLVERFSFINEGVCTDQGFCAKLQDSICDMLQKNFVFLTEKPQIDEADGLCVDFGDSSIRAYESTDGTTVYLNINVVYTSYWFSSNEAFLPCDVYGIYNGHAVLRLNGFAAAVITGEEVAGFEFLYPTSVKISVLHGNSLIGLKQAYEEGLLSQSDIESIHAIHKEKCPNFYR